MKRARLMGPIPASMGWATHLFVAWSSLFFLLWLVPYFDGLPGASMSLDPPNEKTRVLGMVSFGLYGELYINKARARWWTRQLDLSGRKRTKEDPPGTPPMLYFPAKTPGMHMGLGVLYGGYRRHLARKPATLWEATFFARLFGGIIPVWLTSLLFYFVLLRVCRSRYIILSGFFVFLLGNMTYPYALILASHSFANGMLLVAFLAIWWCPRGFWLRFLSAALAGLCIGFAFGAEYSAFFSALWLGVLALLVEPPDLRRYSSRPRPSGIWTPFYWLFLRWHLLVALAVSLLPVAAVLWSHKQLTGSYFSTPYGFMLNESFRQMFNKANFLVFSLPPQWSGSVGALFAPSHGLFFWTPFLGFGLFGVARLWREKRWGFFWMFVTFGSFWALYPSLQYNPRGGWSVGPRYIANLVPFAMLLAVWGADQLHQRYGERMVPWFAVAGVWSILHYAPASVMFPHLPTKLEWPQLDVMMAILQRGLAPSSITSLPANWYMPIYLLALASVCGYLLWAGFESSRRWLGRMATILILCVALLGLFQLPSTSYVSREGFIKYISNFLPSDQRWR